MLDLTRSELVVIGFITFAVVSAPWWPRLGAFLGRLASGQGTSAADAPLSDAETPPSEDDSQLS